MRKREVTGERGGVKLTIYLDVGFLEAVDKLADKLGVNRGKMIRNLAEIGYEDAKLLDAVGLFTLCRKIQDLRKENYGVGNSVQPA